MLHVRSYFATYLKVQNIDFIYYKHPLIKQLDVPDNKNDLCFMMPACMYGNDFSLQMFNETAVAKRLAGKGHLKEKHTMK